MRLHGDLAAAAAGCVLWMTRYWIAYGLHFRGAPHWAGWFDQGKYVESAVAFGHGDLAAVHHWYPLAYSLLAAPFVGITPGDPFFVVNGLLFGGVVWGFAGFARVFGLGPWSSLLILVLVSLTTDSTAQVWLIPWTTTLSAAAIWIALALMVRITCGDVDHDRWSLLLLGCCLGILPLARPTDAIVSALLAAATVVLTGPRWWRSWRTTGMVAAGAALFALPYAALYLSIYGWAPTRYMVEAARQGFAFADLPWKAYVLLVTPQPWYPGAASLVEGLPWLVPGLAGLCVTGLWPGGERRRSVLAAVAVVAIPYGLVFLAYTDLQPSGLWQFNNVHYFEWMFPLFGLGAWKWLRTLVVRDRASSCIFLTTAIMLPACVRIVPVAVGDLVPARLLLFDGRTDRDWNEAYFAPATISDSNGTMRNVRDFHQIPDPAGERAIAITRLFGVDPRRDDAGDAARFRWAERPRGRFAERITVGWPCWLARRECGLPDERRP